VAHPSRVQAASSAGGTHGDRRFRRSAERSYLRFTWIALTLVLLAFAAFEAAIVLPPAIAHPGVTLGMDFTIYMDRARSWLAGDGFYLPWQLTGPYVVGTVGAPPALYPPVLLYLLVPFTILPAVLWWAIPLGIIAVSLYRLRPAVWTWPALAAVLCYPRAWIVLVYGNPSLWVIAALAAGLVWTWPLAFLPVKAPLAPFALLGVRKRAFWAGAGTFVLLALPFGSMWPDYVIAIANARNGFGLEYIVGELPIAVALVVAGIGRTTRSA
jgi:hypothetical protein